MTWAITSFPELEPLVRYHDPFELAGEAVVAEDFVVVVVLVVVVLVVVVVVCLVVDVEVAF